MDVSLIELQEVVMDREAWRAAIHGIEKSWTWLSDWTELIYKSKIVYTIFPVVWMIKKETWSHSYYDYK